MQKTWIDFSPIMWVAFLLYWWRSLSTELLILMYSFDLFFPLVSYWKKKRSLADPVLWRLLPGVSSKNSHILGLAFRSLDAFSFVCAARQESSFILLYVVFHFWGFPGGLVIESACQCRRLSFDLWVRKIPCRRKWNILQCSCLGNPLDRGDWRVTVYGVANELDTTYQLDNNNNFTF